MILLTGLSTALAAAFSPSPSDSVVTQVLPSILIACVALQLTSAQFLPSHSGRTTLDRLFVLLYLHVFLLVLGMELQPLGLHWYGIGLATAVFIGALAYLGKVAFRK